MFYRRLTLLGTLCLLSCLLSACDAGVKRKPTYPAQGKLLLNGKPYAGITLFLHSLDPNETEPTRPFGLTANDGSFSLTTSAQNDGAPAGEYAVTLLYESLESPLSRLKGPKPPPIEAKYTDPKTTPLRITIEAKDKNILEPIDVK